MLRSSFKGGASPNPNLFLTLGMWLHARLCLLFPTCSNRLWGGYNQVFIAWLEAVPQQQGCSFTQQEFKVHNQDEHTHIGTQKGVLNSPDLIVKTFKDFKQIRTSNKNTYIRLNIHRSQKSQVKSAKSTHTVVLTVHSHFQSYQVEVLVWGGLKQDLVPLIECCSRKCVWTHRKQLFWFSL